MTPVDLVYLWCDDADPKWRAKRIATAERFGVANDIVHNGACRYRGGDMLRYSLRSAAIQASWTVSCRPVSPSSGVRPARRARASRR